MSMLMGRVCIQKKIHLQNLEALTSSWSDGSRGPIAFCVPDGALKVEDVKAYNSRHQGESMIVLSGSHTHFMCADTLLQVLEQLYSKAFEIQRARYLAHALLGM